VQDSLGDLYIAQGKLDKAEPVLRLALAEFENSSGPEHWSTLDTVNGLAELAEKQGNWGSDENLYRRAFEGRKKALCEDHQQPLQSYEGIQRAATKLKSMTT
jgi:hypothetical protein